MGLTNAMNVEKDTKRGTQSQFNLSISQSFWLRIIWLFNCFNIFIFRLSSSYIHLTNYTFPSQNCITAHLPPQAHFLALSSPPSPPRNSSSLPSGSPTTTSALQVRNARVRMPECAPSGPIAVSNDVVGSHVAYIHINIVNNHNLTSCERKWWVIDYTHISC